MTLFSMLLVFHIIAGAICLICGTISVFARKKKGVHTLAGEVYHGSYVAVAVTALAMSVMKWSELAFLFFIALFSYAFALYGYLARKRQKQHWLKHHINGMLGSYIGVITAVLVVNGEAVSKWIGIPSWLLWFLPTIIGSPLIRMTIARHGLGASKRENRQSTPNGRKP
ncbi:DUF2306 domain-containing protein [Cohnella pontilimi]|uniref:DUF2306 domain-containing protein n=1 Tax=Cohnella pontilimi TaxID=2564100 RepID=A0A4U0FHJ3_9BACL|nr:DUF2306 domain-containing protein [Cohnella pontilimi]TJY44496.1 DUF2306 domain-containing protein [Cohnella pontilimi]